ncbi:MAG: amidase [Bacteroidetes bacterium]|nr:amidase [Bacteroidota bacterium]
MKHLPLFLLLIVMPMTAQDSITTNVVRNAETMIGLRFSEADRESLLGDVQGQRESFGRLRAVPLPNSIVPSLLFNPIPFGKIIPQRKSIVAPAGVKDAPLPESDERIAFASVGELALWIRTKRLSSERLTRIYLDRIKRYQPMLQCIVTVTESLAIAQAQRADREIAAGKYRGPLHGIPYGAKDLLSTKMYPTTWGSVPYRTQQFSEDATVITKLEEAGAVLIAKTALGELAWGDVWFGGKSKNPWDTTQGSSGSSAGSASGTAAGLFAFSIGSETYGSIVSPSTRCGVTGLRPTYGRVSRYGAMALSWSMDKIGPICRTVEDCALVLQAIAGPDPKDQTLYDMPFVYEPKRTELKGLRIGYLKSDLDSAKSGKQFNDAVLEQLRALGAVLIPVELPAFPVDDIAIMLSAESAAAFDELTRSGKDDLLVRQIKNAWPNSFRASRFITAVEYIQASRVRQLLIQEMERTMRWIDVYVGPSLEGNSLLLTNLTGHPSITVPSGFTSAGHPVSITFTGQLFGEGTLLSVAKKYQDATGHHVKHPVLP